MHISYFLGTRDDYVQVVSHKDQDSKLKALGFVCSVQDLHDAEPAIVEVVESEGTEIDLRAAINDCRDKDEIESLLMSTIGVDLDKRGSLETVKEKAMAALKGHSDEC